MRKKKIKKTKEKKRKPAKEKIAEKIITEIIKVLSKINVKATKEFVDMLLKKRHIFLTGAGRSGLIAQAFAMRLRQFGLESYVIGEVTTPPITSKDLVIAVSGSGKTLQTYDTIKQVKKHKAKIVVVTARHESKIAKEASLVIELKTELNGKVEPLASMFEQSTLIYLDAVILKMLKRKHKSFKEMRKRHFNL